MPVTQCYSLSNKTHCINRLRQFPLTLKITVTVTLRLIQPVDEINTLNNNLNEFCLGKTWRPPAATQGSAARCYPGHKRSSRNGEVS